MTIDRRQFLMLTGFLLLPRYWGSLRFAQVSSVSISWLNISMPAWLFGEVENPNRQIRALSILRNGQTKECTVRFAEMKELQLAPGATVGWMIKQNTNHATRESMLLKRALSYGLDAIVSSIVRGQVSVEAVDIASQFDGFQTQEVLDALSIEAIRELLLAIAQMPAISSVSLDEKQQCFVVE